MKAAILQARTRNKFPFNIAALGIMYFQKTNYSHYAIRVEDQSSGEVFYYDSTGAGTRKYSPSAFKKKYKLIKKFPVHKPFTYIAWLEFWSKHANKPYGFKQVFGLLLKMWNITKNNPFGKGSKRIICNELIILFLNEFGYTNIKDVDSLDLNETEKLLKVLYEK